MGSWGVRLEGVRQFNQDKRYPATNGRVFMAPSVLNPTQLERENHLIQETGSSTLVYTIGGTLHGDPDVLEMPPHAAYAEWSHHLERVCTSEQWDRLNAALQKTTEAHQDCITTRAAIVNCRWVACCLCFLNCPCIVKMTCDLTEKVLELQRDMVVTV